MDRFTTGARETLLARGWRVAEVPVGATLASLLAGGAPLKGDRLLREFPDLASSSHVPTSEVAYAPGLVPDSLNQTVEYAAGWASRLQADLPAGCAATIGPAALYVALLMAHFRDSGAWLIPAQYTWTADSAAGRHVVVGVFGTQRPLLVSAVREPTGRGIGLLPIVIPR